MTLTPKNARPFAYELVALTEDGRSRSVARFKCHKCGRTQDISVKSGESLNGEGFANNLKKLGWEAHHSRAADCICPNCLWARKNTKNDPDSELRKLEETMATQPTNTAAVLAVMDKGPTQAPAPSVPVREPNVDQRGRIRDLLTKYFDDDKGCYIAQWSDKLIAEQVNIPAVIVERIREAAFGPIRVTPQQIETNRLLDALATRIDGVENSALNLLQELNASLGQIKGQLAELKAKVG